MKTVLTNMDQLLQQKEPFVLATILSCSGSAPRGVGASMVVSSQGRQWGTIGGGAVEYAASQHAAELLNTQKTDLRKYHLNPNQIADLGMICGGEIEVLFTYFDASETTLKLIAELIRLSQNNCEGYAVRSIQEDSKPGSICLYDGETLQPYCPELFDWLQTHHPQKALVAEINSIRYLVEPVGETSHVYVFGGGHVAQKLIPLLSYVDFKVIVCEDREEFAKPQLFSQAENIVLHSFDDVFQELSIGKGDYVVIMTRGHQADYTILRQALKTNAFYIGCIGSRHKIALTKQRLREDGFTDQDFARVHTPIGLAIRAETPEEIGISVVAEMIQCRAERMDAE